jgi:PAS domain S-box-containing protein
MNSALNAIITTDNTGRFELVNTSACRIFGLIQGETDGKSMASLIALDDGSHPPEDSMGQFLHEAAGTVRELQGCRVDGSTFPMRMSISEVNSEGQHLFTAILRDITKEKEHQARVAAEERKTAAIMNSALNAIITTDNKGRFELVNTSACRVFGLVPGQTDGKSIASLILLEDGSHPPEDDMGQYLADMAGEVREVEGCGADGSSFPMRMSVSEVNCDGQHLFTAILRDITKEKEDAARLIAANQVIKLERSKLQALLDSTVPPFPPPNRALHHHK